MATGRYRKLSKACTMKRRNLLVTTALVVLRPAARAEEVAAYRDGDVIDPDEVARILGPDSRSAGRTRSIREIVDGPANSSLESAHRRAEALSIPIRFDFDSSEVVPVAR